MGKRKRSKASEEYIEEVVANFRKGKVDLPILPQVVHDVQTVMRKTASSSEDLANVIEKDAVISVRLIAVANSPYYRGIEQITTVRTASPGLDSKRPRT